MSVFKRPGAAVYSYDFRLRNRRFSGSTGRTTKREAERYEQDLKEQIRADTIDTATPMGFAEAASLYWHEVGQHHRNGDDTLRSLQWLQDAIGPATMVSAIDDALVARLVARRRGETVMRRVEGERRPVRVSAATVNRTVTIPLQGILNRSSAVWKQKVQPIEWRRHRLREARERVREATVEEERTIMAAMRDDYRPAIRFALLTGCRRAEIVGLTWQQVDFFTGLITVRGKGDKVRSIPMTGEIRDLLWSLKDHHPTAVFTYVAARARDGRSRGARYPLTTNGFKTAWRRHGQAAVSNFRFHDSRHTTATRLVRASGNLRHAKELLGHEKIETTLKYAHVTDEDLRAAMDAAQRTQTAMQNPTPAKGDDDKSLKDGKKSG